MFIMIRFIYLQNVIKPGSWSLKLSAYSVIEGYQPHELVFKPQWSEASLRMKRTLECINCNLIPAKIIGKTCINFLKSVVKYVKETHSMICNGSVWEVQRNLGSNNQTFSIRTIGGMFVSTKFNVPLLSETKMKEKDKCGYYVSGGRKSTCL